MAGGWCITPPFKHGSENYKQFIATPRFWLKSDRGIVPEDLYVGKSGEGEIKTRPPLSI